MADIVLFFFLFACFCFVILFVLILFRSHRHSKRQPYLNSKSNVRLAVILGSGGHTTEILRLVSSLGPRYAERLYILADTDSTSLAHLHNVESKKKGNDVGRFAVHVIPRSREVRQSYVTSVWTTMMSLVRSLPLVNNVRPDVILCNGPGTCVPVCFSAYFFDLLLFRTCRIIFVESVCRVDRLSLTGKILYHLRLADVVFVQWPKMLERYPRALYLARF